MDNRTRRRRRGVSLGCVLALDPAMPVLLRPDGTVQIGWDPRRAVRVRPPPGLSTDTLAAVLRAMGSPMTRAQAHTLAGVDGFAAVLDGLLAAGVLRERPAAAGRALSIRVHGCGPLSELLTDGLRRSGARLSRSSHANAAGAPAGVDLVVLADTLAADPRLLRDLHAARVPHLPVRVRDGSGLIGPLVIPGVTSCLVCADLHRAERDPAWPALSAQLRQVIGCADHPTVLATAAFALAQLHRIVAGVRGAAVPAPEFDTTWELDVAEASISARRWPRHPMCGCWPAHG